MEATNGKMSVLYSVFVTTKYTWRNMKYPSYFMLRKSVKNVIIAFGRNIQS